MAGTQVTNARSIVSSSRNASGQKIGLDVFPSNIEAVPHKTIFCIRTRSGSSGGTNLSGKVSGAIVLPTPERVVEQYSASYSDVDLGNINATIREITASLGSLPLVGQSVGQGSFDGNVWRHATSGNFMGVIAAGVREAAIRQTAQGLNFKGVGLGDRARIEAAINAGSGTILNPHHTAIFTGVNLRQFQYFWTLAPKTLAESKAVETIFRKFRDAMLPKRKGGSIFLQFPDEVEYKILGPDSGFDMPTTPCVIQDVRLNRTGQEYPSFFAKTGAPTVYTLFMQLMEIRALTRDDFESDTQNAFSESADFVTSNNAPYTDQITQ